MSIEPTPAVQRAAESMAKTPHGPTYGKATRALAAALDVEEMARVLHDESEFADTWDQESQACRNQYLSDARALRAAILGGAA